METVAPKAPSTEPQFNCLQNIKFLQIDQSCRMLTMPVQTRCDRVPATGTDCTKWDLSVPPRDDLPLDPRTWSRTDVASWVSRNGGLPERFPMNGKALCLMTKEMFCARVPSNGVRLHQDFRKRLAKALALQDLIEKITHK